MDEELKLYIRGLGLCRLEWKPVEKDTEDKTDIVLLITRDQDGQFSLLVGKASGSGFMEADDASWHGPVRYLVAWASTDI